jgi:hypothetical protein
MHWQSGKKLILLGVNFDADKRNVAEWRGNSLPYCDRTLRPCVSFGFFQIFLYLLRLELCQQTI